MINFEALFKISYGLYVVCSGDKNKGNGFISNTIFQVSSEPAKFAACCHKNNYSSGIIEKTGAFSASILSINVSPIMLGKFGFKSGKDLNKMEGMEIQYGETGVPIVLNDAIAYLECRVTQKVDLDSHWMFIGELVSADILNETSEALTYLYYRNVKRGIAPKNAPTFIDKTKLTKATDMAIKPKKYKCAACGYIYDESIEKVKFADLSSDWICPACGSEKEDFTEIK